MIDDTTTPQPGEYPEPPGDGDQVMIGWWEVISGAWRWVTNPYA